MGVGEDNGYNRAALVAVAPRTDAFLEAIGIGMRDFQPAIWRLSGTVFLFHALGP